VVDEGQRRDVLRRAEDELRRITRELGWGSPQAHALCQAHWRAGTARSALEAQLDHWLDQTVHGHPPAPEDLRALQEEINRQRLTQPPVPDWYYQLRRSSYEASMRAAADQHAQRIDAAAESPAPDRN
jgi:hypothetical protein